jgi:hypothetical protein
VELLVRAERLELSVEPLGLPNCFKARIEHVIHLGMDLKRVIRLGSQRIVSSEKNGPTACQLEAGADIFVGWTAHESLIVPAS